MIDFPPTVDNNVLTSQLSVLAYSHYINFYTNIDVHSKQQ